MSPLPRFLALWTNSKKPRYKGKGTLQNPMLNAFYGDAHKSRFSNTLVIMGLRTRT